MKQGLVFVIKSYQGNVEFILKQLEKLAIRIELVGMVQFVGRILSRVNIASGSLRRRLVCSHFSCASTGYVTITFFKRPSFLCVVGFNQGSARTSLRKYCHTKLVFFLLCSVNENFWVRCAPSPQNGISCASWDPPGRLPDPDGLGGSKFLTGQDIVAARHPVKFSFGTIKVVLSFSEWRLNPFSNKAAGCVVTYSVPCPLHLSIHKVSGFKQ